MGLEVNIKNVNILDDLQEELSKKLKVKISFDDLEEDIEKKELKIEKNEE